MKQSKQSPTSKPVRAEGRPMSIYLQVEQVKKQQSAQMMLDSGRTVAPNKSNARSK